MATLTVPGPSSSPFSNDTIPSSPPDSPTNRRSTSSSHLAPSSSTTSTPRSSSRKHGSTRRSGGFLLEPRSRNSFHHGLPFSNNGGGRTSPSPGSDRSHSPGSTRALSGTTRVVSDGSSMTSSAAAPVNAFFRSHGSERIKGKGRPNSLRAEDERLKELLARTIEGDTARIVELAGAIDGSSSSKKNRKSVGEDTGGERRMTGTPGGLGYSPAPGWGEIRQNGSSIVPGFFSHAGRDTPQIGNGTMGRKASATLAAPTPDVSASPMVRHKSVSSPQPQQPQLKISEHTWHRAQRAAHYIGLMAQFRSMLANQPPFYGVWDGGNSGRKYNPLQAIRNRRLRRQLRVPPLDETPWEDERVVAEWIDSYPDYNPRDHEATYEEYLRQRPGLPGAEGEDAEEDTLGLGIAAGQRRASRHRTDWYVTPEELFADNYWAEENQTLLEDRHGDKRYPNPTSPVTLTMPELPHVHKEHHKLHKHHPPPPHSRTHSLRHHHPHHGLEKANPRATPEKLKEEGEDGIRRKLKGRKQKHRHHHDHSSSDELEYSEEDSDVPGPEKTFINTNFPRKPSPPPHLTRHSSEGARKKVPMVDEQEVLSSPPATQTQVGGFSWNTSHRRSESPEKSTPGKNSLKSAARKIQQTAIPGKKGRTQSLDVSKILDKANESPNSKHKRSVTAANALMVRTSKSVDSSDIVTPRAASGGSKPSFNVLLSPPAESDGNSVSAGTSAVPSTNPSRNPSARTSLEEGRGRDKKRDSITQDFFGALRRRQSPTKSMSPALRNASSSVKVNEVAKDPEMLDRSSSSLDLKSNMTDTTDDSPLQQSKPFKFGTVKKLRSGAGRVGEIVRNEVAGVGDFLLGTGSDKKGDSASSASSPASSSDEGATGIRKRMSVFGRKKLPGLSSSKHPTTMNVADGNASTDADETDDDNKKLEKKGSNNSSSTRKKFLYRLPRMPSAGLGSSAPPSPLRESQSFDEIERPKNILEGNNHGEDPIAAQSKMIRTQRRPSRFSRLAPPEIETFQHRDRSPVGRVLIESMEQKARRLEEEKTPMPPPRMLSPDGDETPKDLRNCMAVTRNDSVGTMALKVGAVTHYCAGKPGCRKALLRLQAGIMSTGVLCRGITSTTPRMNASKTLYPMFCRPEGGGAVIARVVNRTSTVSNSIKSTTTALVSAQSTFTHKTLSNFMGTLEGLRRDVDLDWYPCVQRMADEADGLNAAVTARDTLEVKKVSEMAERLIRRRGKGMKWVRRWGYVLLEWTLLGVMWLVWLVVVVVKIARTVVGGAFKGVRWFLWLP